MGNFWRLMSTDKKKLRLKGGRLESGEKMLVEVILIYFLGIFLGPISSKKVKYMSKYEIISIVTYISFIFVCFGPRNNPKK